MKHSVIAAMTAAMGVAALAPMGAHAENAETAKLTFAPDVPPPVARKSPAVVRVGLNPQEVVGVLAPGVSDDTRYPFWTFNGRVPGPFIRVREGDTLELTIANSASSAMAHNVDLHAVTGPGGGAALTLVKPGETKTARFKMLKAGLFVYHCAAPPVTDHIANGMYGMILVEPPEGLPKADKEFYVLQSEFYTNEDMETEGLLSYSPKKALAEDPTFVVFNGRVGSLTEDGALQAKVGDRVRIFFGNIGPNKASSFHIIGTIFDRVYREGGFGAEPGRNVQTTLVPAGGAAVVEMTMQVPGDYSLVDHSIFRMQKGAAGTLHVSGPDAPDIYKQVK